MPGAALLKLNSSPSPKPKPQDRFVLRLPKECHKQLVVISRRNRRSMNAEITLLLEKYVEADGINESMNGFALESDDHPLDSAAMALIDKFKDLSIEKQKALLELLG